MRRIRFGILPRLPAAAILRWIGERIGYATPLPSPNIVEGQNQGEDMTYLVILEHRGGGVEALGHFETRKAAMVCINQYRIDDEGHDDYWRLWIEDEGRVIYSHASTHYIIDKLSDAERKSGRILTPG